MVSRQYSFFDALLLFARITSSSARFSSLAAHIQGDERSDENDSLTVARERLLHTRPIIINHGVITRARDALANFAYTHRHTYIRARARHLPARATAVGALTGIYVRTRAAESRADFYNGLRAGPVNAADMRLFEE